MVLEVDGDVEEGSGGGRLDALTGTDVAAAETPEAFFDPPEQALNAVTRARKPTAISGPP